MKDLQKKQPNSAVPTTVRYHIQLIFDFLVKSHLIGPTSQWMQLFAKIEQFKSLSYR